MNKLFGTLVLCAAVLSSGPAFAQNISIATGGTGGVYYPLGGGVAAALSKFVPGMQATAEVTGGSVDNLKLIGSGKPYIAFSMADAAQDAQRGEDKFKGHPVPLKTLMILYPNRMHVVSVEGRGVGVGLRGDEEDGVAGGGQGAVPGRAVQSHQVEMILPRRLAG